jgi:hypothetical protein
MLGLHKSLGMNIPEAPKARGISEGYQNGVKGSMTVSMVLALLAVAGFLGVTLCLNASVHSEQQLKGL